MKKTHAASKIVMFTLLCGALVSTSACSTPAVQQTTEKTTEQPAPSKEQTQATQTTNTDGTPSTDPQPRSGCDQAIDLTNYSSPVFNNPELFQPAQNGEYILDVQYTDPNTTKINDCGVKLRSYNGKLVGPTLRAKPGDTLYIRLTNNLPPNVNDNQGKPTNLNTTNLHTHGLHVSPAGNSDNVLLELQPKPTQDAEKGQEFLYEIKIPKKHVPGTYWYHAHVHGSTAVQVGSGMAGALIIEGGLDEVPEIKAAKERILMLQQPSYGVSKPHVIVNGQLYPTITMKVGEVERWRFINATASASLQLKLDQHDLHEIALDGNALGKIDTWNSNQAIELHPGYRSDVLVKASNEGTYNLYYGDNDPQNYVAKLVVQGKNEMNLPSNDVLAPYKPYTNITDDEVKGHQQRSISFSIKDSKFMINNDVFPQGDPIKVNLGDVEEWELSVAEDSQAPSHPFHIHVNDFQVTRKAPDGNDEIVWKDTLMVNKGQNQKIRTRFEDYIGTFVLHCHILGHEDAGMMKLVEIEVPGSASPHMQH